MYLQASNLQKRFGNTTALRGVSVSLRAGRVHAFAGENGAGKSTLLKILAGAERHDSGDIHLDSALYAPLSLGEAEARGVGLVFQELTVNASLSVAENIYIDRLRDFANGLGWISRWRIERDAQMMLDEISAGISVNSSLDSLNLGQWKCLEICRALARRPQVLFLDESTAFLGHKEVQAVLAVIRRLRDQGLTVGFVSHHIEEVEQVADDVIILKDGALVGQFNASDMTSDQMHALMVGRDLSESIYPARSTSMLDEQVLAITGVGDPRSAIELHRGEILGIAGLKGSGGELLLSVLAGDRPCTSEMSLTLCGRPYTPHTPYDAWQSGISYLPGDRGGEGLILDFTVRDNLVLSKIPRRGPFYDGRAATEMASRAIARLDVRPGDPDRTCRSLSGGNMQKVVLGKCLVTQPTLLLLNNPTRGVDVGAREEIYKVIRALADSGTAVMLLSEDLPEVIGMSDRIVVMRRGTITQTIGATEPRSEEDVIRHMV